MNYRITKEVQKNIIDYYLSRPMSLQECSNKFNLCKPTIAKVLNDNNIPRYSKNQIFNPIIYNYLYNNASIFLKRKHDTFLAFEKYYNS